MHSGNLNPKKKATIETRVATAAAAALAEKQFVSPIDVLLGIRWLDQPHLDDWRHRRLPFLEAGIQTNPSRISAAMRAFHDWAVAAGLKPSETAYVARSAGREPLRFTESGEPAIEQAYRTHWISPALPESKRARVEAKASAPPDLVAVEARHDWKCHRCSSTGAWLVMEAEGPACLGCLGMGDLVMLPSGDALGTRRARKASPRNIVVVRWSRHRKRYERIGLLVEPHALEVARAASTLAR